MALGTSCDTSSTEAVWLMDEFAERTGLTSDRRQQRYLWTDAFAVCNFLGIAPLKGERWHLDLALHLVKQNHHMPGRHREDDPREGWISGLNPAALAFKGSTNVLFNTEWVPLGVATDKSQMETFLAEKI